MVRKKRTRQQKIIARLRRELKKQKITAFKEKGESLDENKATLKILKKAKATEKLNNKKQEEKSTLSYNPELIKKDLIKTSFLGLIFLAIILIIKFFRLEGLLFR